MMRAAALLSLALAVPSAAGAQALAAQGAPLALPAAAERSGERIEALGSHSLPLGPYMDSEVQMLPVEGAISQSAWRLHAPGATTLQLLAPLREQLEEAGFTLLYDCEDDICGGFDFRYAAALLPEPDMHVDLGDYRFLSAQKGEGATAEYLELWVSRSSEHGFVQITHIRPADGAPLAVTGSAKAPAPASPFTDAAPRTGIASALQAAGVVALDDLDFATASSNLGEGSYASLAELADYLAANPDQRITLVGHTDAVGSIDANITLSRSRAASVMDRLVRLHGVPPAQLAAEGAGYLAPRASNLTDEGRARNRRVEAMLTPTQ
ncbi:OmpA family protein [Frigidibacter albus]|uniref:OmpA family protein n=1 Tax=Frigidibacter albus TaxID=1465486 RepID=A0A6L8VJ89_9RHOB|nr:OmpA family protein [Frigidibacter albus]MZQ90448.1 OmpA family protein [Frigidibacter albus]NBE32432.1 OmpA family protein [Frigidibacter albus]GGH59726.1 membrane protein [Frigidibacter albus]